MKLLKLYFDDFIQSFHNFKNRQACEHATHGLPEDKAKTEGCLIARAYTLACNSIALPTPLPDVCSQCEVGGTTYKSDVEFDVTTPQNQADIILAVETTKVLLKIMIYFDLLFYLYSQSFIFY